MRANVGEWVERVGVFPPDRWLVTAWPDVGLYLICERRDERGQHQQTAFFSFDVQVVASRKPAGGGV